jgi:site-specific recombinase XerD
LDRRIETTSDLVQVLVEQIGVGISYVESGGASVRRDWFAAVSVNGMPMSVESRWPVIGRNERAAEWLRIWTDLGRAPRTIDAYARGLAEYLQVCEREGIDPLTASRAHVAVFVRELTSRPSRRGANVVALDSGTGLANATLQQRVVPVRLFYDFLVEEGVRESNPVGRGRYTPGRSGTRASVLVPRMVKLPWIPSEAEWLRLLGVVAEEPVRNRVMLALAYDAALRR